MDKILIEGLEVRAHVGVPEWERKKLQKILIDIELSLDLKKAGRTDNVKHTVDYAAVAMEVTELVRSRQFKLIEAMAEQIAALILKKFRVKEVHLRIRKFSVPGTSSVGLSLARRS